MPTKQHIKQIYEEVRSLYAPETREILNGLFNDTHEVPKIEVMFPPLPGSTFTSQEAEAGFLKHDCVIVTSFRATRTKEENEQKNLELENEMKARGLHFLYVDGCFREAREKEASHEDSFFVYDNGTHKALDFFTNLYELSEKYEQDSFLYKSAGLNRTAYLISTNEDSRIADGNVKLAGQLYLNLPPVGPYTELGRGRITFLLEAPVNKDK